MEEKQNELAKKTQNQIKRNIQNVGGHLAGVVVNKMPVSVKKYNENYYYASTASSSTARMNANEIRRKADNAIKQNSDTYKNNIVKKQNDIDTERLSKPVFLKDNTPDTTIEKSNKILKEMNSYLDKQRKDLNK